MSSTRTQQPTTQPTTPDHDNDGKRWYAQPLLWVVVALVAATAVIAVVLLNRTEEPAAQLPASPAVDSAAQEQAAQDAYQDYEASLNAAYEARDVGPLVGQASSEVIDPLRDYFADMTYADITASGENVSTTEVADYRADAPEPGWTSVVLDVCTDSSGFQLTLPDGSDASRGPDGGTDYLTSIQSTVTMVNNTPAGAERWIVQSIESDYATAC